MPPDETAANPPRREIEAYATRVLLRYFQASRRAEGSEARADVGGGVLRRQWALSASVRALSDYTVATPMNCRPC